MGAAYVHMLVRNRREGRMHVSIGVPWGKMVGSGGKEESESVSHIVLACCGNKADV